MMRFNYTAERAGGEMYTGVADAADRFELYSIVRREGGRIISFTEEGRASWLSFDILNGVLTFIKEYDKVVFARNVGAMLAAGLPLSRALAVLERQIKNAKLKGVVMSIASDVRRGASLHEALAKFPKIFSNLFVAMVRSGEEGGSLPEALAVVSEQMERVYQLKKKIRGALIYPAIIVVAIIGIGTIMMVYVVPTLAHTFKEMGAELPLTTRVIIGISDFLVLHTMLVFAGALGSFLILLAAARTVPGKRFLDFIFLHTPMIGTMMKEVNSARTARTLSSLLQSGVDVLSSLEIAGQVVQNSYFREVIKDAGLRVGKGEPLSSAFSRRGDLYPSFVPEMMGVGEETGALAEMLKRLAVFYEEEVDRKTKDMSTVIEPFLMIVIGGAVGFFAVSMIMPIYSLSQNIG